MTCPHLNTFFDIPGLYPVEGKKRNVTFISTEQLKKPKKLSPRNSWFKEK